MSGTSAHQRFFLADEKHVNIKGHEVVVKDILYFEFYRPNREDAVRGVPFEVTSKATKEHVQQYAQDYKKFQQAHPDYKLPWGEDVDFVGVKAQEAGTVVITEKLPELPPLEEVPVETVEVVASEPEKLEETEKLPEPEVDLVSESLPESVEIVGNPGE